MMYTIVNNNSSSGNRDLQVLHPMKCRPEKIQIIFVIEPPSNLHKKRVQSTIEPV